MAVAPGITAASPFDFTYYPYSHGLFASLLWGAFFFLVFAGKPSKPGSTGRRAGYVVAAVTLSHFLLDLITHRADLLCWAAIRTSWV
ncbi:MAG: hypothetical protein M1379_07985 [Firmicutes bacterium]|nr:hypothetical protein [Bacillota bacterium]